MTKPTKASVIREALADDIVHGRLAPGTPLDEKSMAARFGVSRTPLREAFRQLEAIGLAKARAHHGMVVTALSDRQLNEMFAVMGELEALCASWSALAMSAGERRVSAMDSGNRDHDVQIRREHRVCGGYQQGD